MPMIRIRLGMSMLVAFAAAVAPARAEERPEESIRMQAFDKDPGWEGHNNRLLPEVLPTVVQDFGYSDTNFAGTSKGEVGGKVVRCMAPGYYAAEIGTKTLNDKLSASG